MTVTATTDRPNLRRSFLARRRAIAQRVAAQLLRGPLAMALATAGLAAPARAVSRTSLDDERGLADARRAVHGAVSAVLDELAAVEDPLRADALDAALLCAVAAQEAVAVASAPAPRTQHLEDAVTALRLAADAAG